MERKRKRKRGGKCANELKGKVTEIKIVIGERVGEGEREETDKRKKSKRSKRRDSLTLPRRRRKDREKRKENEIEGSERKSQVEKVLAEFEGKNESDGEVFEEEEGKGGQEEELEEQIKRERAAPGRRESEGYSVEENNQTWPLARRTHSSPEHFVPSPLLSPSSSGLSLSTLLSLSSSPSPPPSKKRKRNTITTAVNDEEKRRKREERKREKERKREEKEEEKRRKKEEKEMEKAKKMEEREKQKEERGTKKSRSKKLDPIIELTDQVHSLPQSSSPSFSSPLSTSSSSSSSLLSSSSLFSLDGDTNFRILCPHCSRPLVQRNGRWGSFFACDISKGCHYSISSTRVLSLSPSLCNVKIEMETPKGVRVYGVTRLASEWLEDALSFMKDGVWRDDRKETKVGERGEDGEKKRKRRSENDGYSENQRESKRRKRKSDEYSEGEMERTHENEEEKEDMNEEEGENEDKSNFLEGVEGEREERKRKCFYYVWNTRKDGITGAFVSLSGEALLLLLPHSSTYSLTHYIVREFSSPTLNLTPSRRLRIPLLFSPLTRAFTSHKKLLHPHYGNTPLNTSFLSAKW